MAAILKESKPAKTAIKEVKNPKIFLIGVNNGAITPAENHATAKFVRNSE